MQTSLSDWCLRLGIVYLILGMALGAHMGMAQDFTQKDLHAHTNLLGYVSTFLIGLYLRAVPQASSCKFTRWAVIAILVTVPVMLVLLGLMYMGNTALEPALGISSFAVLLAYVAFAICVFRATTCKQ